MAEIQFGTDGWRAVIAEDFTFENVGRVAQALADYWNAHPISGTKPQAIVGYDRRFLSDQFARCATEVFAANGFHVTLTAQPTPTPAVSLAVKPQRAIGGVKFIAADGSWLMLRGSGTEPILRIYPEAKSEADAALFLELGVRITRRV
jgi:phosphomannomutase